MAVACSGVPKHVTWLFSVLCCFQVLLFMQVSKTLWYVDNTQAVNQYRSSVQHNKILQSKSHMDNKGLLLQTQESASDLQKARILNGNQRNLKDINEIISTNVEYHSRRTHQIVSEDYILNNSDSDEYESPFYEDYNITHLINQPHACSVTYEDGDDKSPYLLVLVHSHPSHKAQRDAIRDTWGKIRKDFDAALQVRLVFILGLSESDLELKGPKKESKLYRDIVIGTFMDSYRNLTLKSVYGLQWTKDYCPQAKYILKTDDDTYFNLPALLQQLPSLSNISLLGSLNSNAPVQRQGLWQVNQAQFPQPTYPPYCSGCAYVLNQDILSALLTAAKSIPMLPIEDVYVTGLLAHSIGEQCKHATHFPYWYMGPSPKHICLLLNERIFGLHNVPYERMYSIYSKLKSGHRCGSP